MVMLSDRRFFLKQFRVICHAIATYEDISTLLQHLAEGTTRSCKAKGCSIMVLDDQECQLVRVASYGISEEYLNKGPVVFTDDTNCALYTGETVFVEDMQNDLKVQYPEAAEKEGIVTMLSIPIISGKPIIGVLRIYFDTPRKPHQEDIDTLSIMTELLGLAIDNNGMKNCLAQVQTILSGLPPRMQRYFEKAI